MINIFKSDFERRLYQSSILNNTPQLNVADLKHLMRGFDDQASLTTRSVFQKFFICLPTRAGIRVRLKILAACHVLLDDCYQGITFSDYLTQWDGFPQIIDLQDDKFVQFYFHVLQRFANNVTLLNITKSQKSYSIKQFDQFQTMCYKAINVLNFIFASTNLIHDTFKQCPEEILFEILLLLWNDVIALYIFIEKFMIEFGQDYSQIPIAVFTQFYQLIPDFNKLRQQIKEFYNLHNICPEKRQIKEPKWKEINEKTLLDIKNYNQIVKISTTRHKLQKQGKKRFSNFTPQSNIHQQFFSNTTLGYVKRLSTFEDPFEQSTCENGGYQYTQQ